MSYLIPAFLNFVQNIINNEAWIYLIMSLVVFGLIACFRRLAY